MSPNDSADKAKHAHYSCDCITVRTFQTDEYSRLVQPDGPSRHARSGNVCKDAELSSIRHDPQRGRQITSVCRSKAP